MELRFFTLLDYYLQLKDSDLRIFYYVLYQKKYPPYGEQYYEGLEGLSSNQIDLLLISQINDLLKSKFKINNNQIYPRAFQGSSFLGKEVETEDLAMMTRLSRVGKEAPKLTVRTAKGETQLRTKFHCSDFEGKKSWVYNLLPRHIDIANLNYSKHLSQLDFINPEEAENILTNAKSY